MTAALSGRRAQAARNDQVILDAARTVFVNDPTAPISAVAHEAGVGISALYRRYPSKEELLGRLCADGLRTYIEIARAALETDDPWTAFRDFVQGVIDADVHSLSVHLGGRFTPTEEHGELAAEAGGLGARLVERARDAGAIRADFDINDLAMLQEQLAAIRLGDEQRTAELRRRYLSLHLDALRPGAASGELPGTPPTAEELGARWTPR